MSADRPPIVGLTGGVGAGKSTAARMLEERGFVVVDAHEAAHDALDRPDVREDIRTRFGEAVVNDDGSVDRAALGRIAFADAATLKQLTDVIYPVVGEILKERLDALRSEATRPVLLEAPTLFEAGCETLVDTVVTVEADADLRERRCTANRGWPAGETERRERLKISEAERRKRSDTVIENNGTKEDLRSTVDELAARLLAP